MQPAHGELNEGRFAASWEAPISRLVGTSSRSSAPSLLQRAETQRLSAAGGADLLGFILTVANLSDLDPAVVDGFRAVLRGGVVLDDPRKAFAIRRALPHGHAAAVLGMMKRLGFRRLLGRRTERSRDLALAAVAARILDPASKLATARALDPETASTSLGTLLKLGAVTGNEMLAMLDWLLERQPWIEMSLANRHLKGEHCLSRARDKRCSPSCGREKRIWTGFPKSYRTAASRHC